MGTQRLSAARRRALLVDAGAAQFAAHAYDDVQMDEVAAAAGVSRALLYRHFAGKRELFLAVYQQAADRLVAITEVDPRLPLRELLDVGLDAHIDYFLANRNTVLAANKVLAGDPTIQAVITGELDQLRHRMLRSSDLPELPREVVSAVLMSWLSFVRVLCVQWLEHEAFSRDQLKSLCLGALAGCLQAEPVVADQR